MIKTLFGTQQNANFAMLQNRLSAVCTAYIFVFFFVCGLFFVLIFLLVFHRHDEQIWFKNRLSDLKLKTLDYRTRKAMKLIICFSCLGQRWRTVNKDLYKSAEIQTLVKLRTN